MAKTSNLFIRTQDGIIYRLDATVDVNYSQSGSPTEYAIEAGFKSSDHYKQDQDTISFSGQVSAVKFSSQGEESTSLLDFEKGITALKKSGKFFTCSFSDNLPVMKNCLFTSLNLKRDNTTGQFALDVSFTIKQVIVANQANIVATPQPASAYVDVVEKEGKGSSGTTETTTGEKKYLAEVVVELQPSLAPTFEAVGGIPNATQN